MGWLIKATEPPPQHHCTPPGKTGFTYKPDFPTVKCVDIYVQGSLWVCDECGQNWHGRNRREWWPVSPRFARKLLTVHS